MKRIVLRTICALLALLVTAALLCACRETSAPGENGGTLLALN